MCEKIKLGGILDACQLLTHTATHEVSECQSVFYFKNIIIMSYLFCKVLCICRDLISSFLILSLSLFLRVSICA